MLPLITAKIKDDTLYWLCSNIRPNKGRQINLAELLDYVNVDFDTMNAVLYDFQDSGLLNIKVLNRNNNAFLILQVRAHDLLNRGGFSVIDALNEANIQKILYELEHLKKQIQGNEPDQLEMFNKITTIASSLTAVLVAFSSKN